MSDNPLKKWQTNSSEYLVKDRWITLRADSCVTPTGHTIEPYYVIEYPDWVNCVVISDEGEVTLLRHYRHAINGYVLEILGAIIDSGETPEETMKRELEEEVGLVGADIQRTGAVYANPSMLTNTNYCFIAIGGSFDGHKEDEPGADFVPVKMPLSELLKTIEDQTEVMQSLHVSSIMLALAYLRKHRPDLLPN